MTADDTWSGRPRVGFSKCVYLKVTKLLALRIHDASAVPMRCHASLPVPAVGAVVGGNCVPGSRRGGVGGVRFSRGGWGGGGGRLAEPPVGELSEFWARAEGGGAVLPLVGGRLVR